MTTFSYAENGRFLTQNSKLDLSNLFFLVQHGVVTFEVVCYFDLFIDGKQPLLRGTIEPFPDV